MRKARRQCLRSCCDGRLARRLAALGKHARNTPRGTRLRHLHPYPTLGMRPHSPHTSYCTPLAPCRAGLATAASGPCRMPRLPWNRSPHVLERKRSGADSPGRGLHRCRFASNMRTDWDYWLFRFSMFDLGDSEIRCAQRVILCTLQDRRRLRLTFYDFLLSG